MERAGSEDMGDDVERKGLGAPATRADVIEKLVKDGFVKREKKQMIPTEDGVKLITVLPDMVKSPKLTADWENARSAAVIRKFGAYCKNKCGMNVSRAMGAALTDSQIKSMLEGKKTLVKGLKGKKGSYDAYLIPEGIEDYSYTKDGKEIKVTQYKVKLEFPKRKNNRNCIKWGIWKNLYALSEREL
jgi:DNA topoisomerase-3